MRFHRLRALCLMVAFFLGSAVVCAQEADPEKKLAVPTEEAQANALKVIKELYKPDYERAKKPQEKLLLARKLYKEAEATKDDVVSRYVLFRIVRDIAVNEDDIDLAIQGIDTIDSEYEVNIFALLHESLSKIFESSKKLKGLIARDLKEALMNRAFMRGNDAVILEKYEDAKKLHGLALDCAGELKDKEWKDFIAKEMLQAEKLAARHSYAMEAKKILESTPDDPAANRILGTYLCEANDDWSSGCSYLAKADNENLQAAAKIALVEKPDWVKVGDLCWTAAEEVGGSGQARLQLLAAIAYWNVYYELSGLTKTRVDRALDQVPAEVISDHAAYKWRAMAGKYINSRAFEDGIVLSWQPFLGESFSWKAQSITSYRGRFDKGRWLFNLKSGTIGVVERIDADRLAVFTIPAKESTREPKDVADLAKRRGQIIFERAEKEVANGGEGR